MFVDRVVVHVEAGDGGSGISSFLRAKFYPMAGPDGGDGGRGGDVYVRGDRNLGTLLDFTYRDLWKAERGNHGEGNDKTGKSGGDIYLPVPTGTVIRDRETNEIVAEVMHHDETILVAKGGRGGRGNAFFTTSTHQSPREWQPGEEGIKRDLEFELKLIADVGLVGQPNAGKSTLLSVISAARPKIGNYPFTTLSPNLGVVPMSDHRSFVVADIPGIIEGAHEGKGLGLQFLRHIERTRVLAFLIPIESDDWQTEFDQLRHEVASYSDELAKKPFCVVFTKLDLLGEYYVPEINADGAFARLSVSAPGRMGLTELLDAWWSELLVLRVAEAAAVTNDELYPEFSGVRIDKNDADYPAAFLNLALPPKAIWVAGTLATASAPAVAIVGTRHASPYGIRVAKAIAAACARAGVCVVSGLARGIDAAAHEGALEAGGRTVAVLGTSIDIAYPRAHRALQSRIAAEGLLISEMEPGFGAQPFTFPRRNRMIAALSQLVVVVEAGERSGAQITVDHANALGISVAAVPGLIDSPQAYGTNRLLRDGVNVIAEPDDVLALLNVDASPVFQPSLSGDDASMWDALSTGSAEVATLAKRAGMNTRTAAAAISSLEIAGLVQVDLLGIVHATVGVNR